MNVRADTFIISRHGWDLIAPIGILSFFLLLFVGLSLFSLIIFCLLAFLIYLYRNPERVATFAQEGSILSCVDAEVKDIISLDKSPIDGKPGFEIVLQTGFLDVGMMRSPISSQMSVEKLQRGAMIGFDSSHSELNEYGEVRFSSSVGDILVRHNLGSWTRPLCFATEGDILQNQRYGMMLRGRTSVYLPSNSRVAIKEGMSLKAGESVIGFFSETA